MSPRQSITSGKAIAVIVFLEALIIVFAWWAKDTNIVALQTTARLSGRLSLFVFSIILVFLFSNQELLTRLLSKRYYLLFAVVHGIHLVELLIYVQLSHTQLIPYRLTGGFLAYVFIFVMPWLEHRFRVRRMPATRFAKVQHVYLYYIWFIFFMAYLPRVLGSLPNAGGTYAEHLTLFGWTLIVLILHLILRFRKHIAVIA